jgi:hypothetical protein
MYTHNMNNYKQYNIQTLYIFINNLSHIINMLTRFDYISGNNAVELSIML